MQNQSDTSKNIKIFFLPFLVLVFLGVVLIEYIPQYFTIELSESNIHPDVQVFYDTGRGFSEEQSAVISLKKKVKVETFLTSQSIARLRIDLGKGSHQLLIKSVSFRLWDNSIFVSAPDVMGKIIATNDVSYFQIVDDKFLKVVPSGNDPYIILDNSISEMIASLKQDNTKYLRFSWLAKIAYILLCSILFLLIIYYKTVSKTIIKWYLIIIKDNKIFGRVLILISIIWFTVQACYFAVSVDYGVPPDERYHYSLSKLHSEKAQLILNDTENTYKFGSISTGPYLYHFIAGRVLWANPLKSHNVLILRLFNIIIGIGTLILTWKLVCKVTSNRFSHAGVMIIATNLLMYVFVYASVSYTALGNFLSLSASYFIVRSIQEKNVNPLIISFIFLLCSTLVKIVFIPLLGIHLLGTIVVGIWYRISFSTLMKQANYSLVLLMLFIAGLNVHLYGSNYLEYSTLNPSAEIVIGKDNALKHHALTKRNVNYVSTRNERAHISIHNYIPSWYKLMESRIVGIMAHKNLFKSKKDRDRYSFLLFIGLLFMIFNCFKILEKKDVLYLFAISLGYGLVLLLHNYHIQDKMRVFGLVVQGRYIFPVLIQLSVCIFYSLFLRTNLIFSYILLFLIGYVFLPGGIVYFICNESRFL